jgi:hypothetical protein
MSNSKQLFTTVQANAVYDVVVALAGASERLRGQWLPYATSDNPIGGLEFRFGGLLGAGGKLVYDSFRKIRVTCGKDDRNPARDAVIKATNEALAQIEHAHR